MDVHVHFLTDHYVRTAKDAGHLHPDGGPGWPTWSAAEHLDLMDRCSIAASILSISSPGVSFGDPAATRALARHVNDAGAEVQRAHPSRFGHFAALLPASRAGSTPRESVNGGSRATLRRRISWRSVGARGRRAAE
ncbi:MAG TPA: hypothetical protein VK735_04640 [Pseudonocardia sp.]|uniref:hypothetical protein n=1 Tax=Pseudonocardia sp. TaxID=60912 RepID=UPI002B9C3536|nr:hypothetical protein [Pseudonocardia sp.]HTF46719.1 hypothetical protein [Pseudonocardia sp.]